MELPAGDWCANGASPRPNLGDIFSKAVVQCQSADQLADLLGRASRAMGFAHFALLHHASLWQPARPYIRIDNYPAQWVKEMVDRGFARDDPVHAASRCTALSFRWQNLGCLIPLKRRHLSILERSRCFGLIDGFTVPVHIPGEPGGSCSFAVASGSSFPNSRLACADHIGRHAFDAARRLQFSKVLKPRPHLSRRQVQCLRLLAAGKTDFEIATILGIGFETARQYVKRAREAYGVVTRAQLVAVALRDQWLTFEDALDARD